MLNKYFKRNVIFCFPKLSSSYRKAAFTVHSCTYNHTICICISVLHATLFIFFVGLICIAYRMPEI